MTHGTHAGYRAHRRRGEPACEPCNEANNPYVRLLRVDAGGGNEWYHPSQLMRADDPERPARRTS